MTESEGYNFQTGMNKYPSRFLWEIKDNLYVRQGFLPQEFIDEAKKQIEFEKELLNLPPIPILDVGDIVEFSNWGEGRVISKNDEQKTYMIHFDKLNGERPIRYDWRGLKKQEKEENTTVNTHMSKENSVDLGNETINIADFTSESNQEIEKEQLKEDTFLSNMKNIFRMKR
jgi:DNA helicase-2/ATP-dependent DNA helicase PcrA